MVYSLLSANIVCMVMFEAQFKKSWLHNLLFWFIFAFCDMITVIIWSIIEENTLNGILSDYQLMLGSNILNIIFMFVAYRVYMTVMQRFTVKSIQIKLSAFMIGMTFFQVYIVGTYSVEIKNRVGGINLIIILIGCLIINIFLAYILKQKCLWSCYVTKTFSPERNFYPYCSRHSHPCNGIFLPYFSQQIFPCRRNRSVSADFPSLHTCLCCNFSRDRDGSGAPGCRLCCKKAVCKSLFLPESSTALFSFSFHLLSFSAAEKCCFPHHSHTW